MMKKRILLIIVVSVMIIAGGILISNVPKLNKENVFARSDIVQATFGMNNFIDGENSFRVENLGNMLYTLKTLGGLFYRYEDKLYLIAGTENAYGTRAQVFVYSITDDVMIYSKVIEEADCILAFEETGEDIYFATIGKDRETGGNLYSYSKTDNEIKNRNVHFEDQGVYAMDYDGADTLWIGTSNTPCLYAYSISKQKIYCMLSDFTDSVYIRTMKYVNGRVYMGIGSKADLIVYNVDDGKYRSLLPNDYKENSFVYSIDTIDDTLYFLVKNDMGIYSMDLNECNIIRREATYRAPVANSFSSEEGLNWVDIEGDLLTYQNCNLVSHETYNAGVRVYYDDVTGNSYSLEGNGVLSCYYQGIKIQSRDFIDDLEKSYIRPQEFMVYNDVIYLPWRRFIVWDRKSDSHYVYTVNDEPQAAIMSEHVVYTGSYPLCTIQRYSTDILLDSAYKDLNDSKYVLADVDDQCRPSQMDITPDGKYLIMGSGPVYGEWGGAITVVDIETGNTLYTDRDIISEQTVNVVKCSDYYDGCVWLGMIPFGESTDPVFKEEPAHLILWDIEEENIVKDFIVADDVRRIMDIEESDSLVYCITENLDVVSFNSDTEKMIAINEKDNIADMLILKDGSMLGISYGEIYEMDKESLDTVKLMGGFYRLSNLRQDPVTERVYFFDDVELMEVVSF